jgi:hypothetical protein
VSAADRLAISIAIFHRGFFGSSQLSGGGPSGEIVYGRNQHQVN